MASENLYCSKNSKQVKFDYTAGNVLYMNKTGIYHKLYYKEREFHRITEVFTNGKI